MGLEPSIHPTLWGISSAALLLHSALDSLVPPLGHRGVSLHPFALQKGLFLQPVVPDSKRSLGEGAGPISQPMLCCVAGGAGGGLAGQHACLEAGHPAEEARR